MESRESDEFLAVMPFSKVGVSEWTWLGASLAKTMGQKLIIAGLVVVPYYDLKHVNAQVGAELLLDWEALIRLSEFLEGGTIVTGSYLFDEKRLALSVYAVRETGFSLLGRDEDSRENFMSVIDRLSQEVMASIGGSNDLETRGRVEAATATRNPDAYQAMVAALEAWSAGNLEAVHQSVKRAQAFDPDYHDPLAILTQATRQLGDPKGLRTAQKTQLTHLMTPVTEQGRVSSFQALVILEEMLAYAQQSGNQGLEADCLKARHAIESNRDMHAPGRIYYTRVTELEKKLQALVGEQQQRRLKTLREHGWNIGQIAASYLMAHSWLRQAEVNLEVGHYATARLYAQRASNLYAALGDSPQRQQAKRLLSRVKAALPAR